jgi:hypothetical protein
MMVSCKQNTEPPTQSGQVSDGWSARENLG